MPKQCQNKVLDRVKARNGNRFSRKVGKTLDLGRSLY